MPTEYGDEEGMGPLEKGRHRYQRKQYPGALEAFAEAVRMSTEHLLITALDHRAATYEKLNQLQQALKDSREMIKLKPEASKGYLRCGKILQLKGEHELALKIYELGLKRVKIGTDKERVTLQSMFAKLQQSQAPKKTLDPLCYLPFELAEMVMEELSMRDRVICLAVSKSWKRLLESSHKLWTTFDSSRAKRRVTQKSLSAYLKRSNYTVEQAIVSMTARFGFDSPKMKYLTRTCANLQRLEITNTGVIGDSLIEALPAAKALKSLVVTKCQISMSAIRKALEIVQDTILEAEFTCVSRAIPGTPQTLILPKLMNLRSLRLRSLSRKTLPLQANLHESIPGIKVLSLANCSLHQPLQCLKDLEYFKFADGYMNCILELPQTLKHLDLDGTLVESGDVSVELNLPLLETFSCEGAVVTTNGDPSFLLEGLEKAVNLKHLRVGRGECYPLDLFPPSNVLEELSLGGLTYTEQEIIDVTKNYPKLQRLNVAHTMVTGVAIRHFVKLGIRWLNIEHCFHISPDAVRYARMEGVQVQYAFPKTIRPRFRDLPW